MTTTAEEAPRGARHILLVIADNFPIFRAGLRRLLEADGRLQIVGESALGRSVLALVRDRHPDILLLGARTPGTAWRDTLRQFADTGVAVRTILMVTSIDAPDVADALECGACGVIAQDATAGVLLQSIDTVMAGQYWVGHDGAVADLAACVRRFEEVRRREQQFGLTRRELDIVRAVVDGDTNREIAARFSISENTVKRHLLHIFNKVGASSRVELALFVTHHRLFESV
jgi:two-component system, NarL family, nitrate/nitrite response regulator NarL